MENIILSLKLSIHLLYKHSSHSMKEGRKRDEFFDFDDENTEWTERPMFTFDLIPKTLDFEVTNICRIKVIKVR